jgi:hypothetical protein
MAEAARKSCPHLVVGEGGRCEHCFMFVGDLEPPYDPAPEKVRHVSLKPMTIEEEADYLRRKLRDKTEK